MEFKNNLKFDEIMLRYAIMMIMGIIAGVTHQFWMIIPTMFVFLEAILGWCPIKQMFTKASA